MFSSVGDPGGAAEGLAPLSRSYKEHPEPPSFPTAVPSSWEPWGHCSLLAVWEGEEPLVWLGNGGSYGPLCLLCWFCNNHGPSAQGSAWISGTELFKWGKTKEWSPPTREDAFSEMCCCGLLHFVGLHIHQMINVNQSHTVIPSLATGFPFQSQAKPEFRTGVTHSWLLPLWLENTKLHFSCCVSQKTGAVDQEYCASLPVLWLTAACL